MCGIVGAIGKFSDGYLESRLPAAIGALDHRGPDDKGYEILKVHDRTLVFGHTRLSIIDLTSAGHQPMHSSDGRYKIIFNGEIYNYRELRSELGNLGITCTTDTDTEVLLLCWITWGPTCLEKLRGMFAFAIYDSFANDLVLVRDAFGIKPLYYSLGDGNIFFASELPSLKEMLPSKPALNIQRAYDYLVVGRYDNEEDSFYDGVKHLMPGHILNFKVSQEVCNKVAISRWWRPSIAERVDLSLQDAAEVVREKFLQNIKLHMRSDVPIGAALSGGLDSTAVVCAMRHLEPNMEIQTFSYIATGTVADEESWVDLVNQNIGGISHKVVMKPGDLASDIDDMILSQGEPFGGTSVYAQYRVYKLAKERGVTVMLDGQGADEMLAGYTGYPSQRMQSLINKNQYYQAIKFWNNWAKWPGRSSSQMLKILFAQYTPPELSQIALKFVGKNVSPPWLRLDYCNNSNIKLFQLNESKEAEEGEGELHGRRVVGALRSALASGYGVNALLRHADRNSMRWSVESRVPFLTTDLAEFLLSMPENYLISETGETKNIFRLAMQNIVPDMVLKRRDKIGFQTPEKDLISQLGKKAYEWIDAARNIEFLDADLCFREVDGIIKGEKKFNLQAWRLINFCRWTQIT